MQVREAVAKCAIGYVDDVKSRGEGTFHSKNMRDAVAMLLKRQGVNVRKSSIRSQNLHPEYVTDYVGTLETGFGNTQYMTYWPVLYGISIVR